MGQVRLLVGGGVGLPPMLYLAQYLQQAGWDSAAFIGARSRDLLAVTLKHTMPPDPTARPLPCVVEFSNLGFDSVIATDDGSIGLKGLITTGLEQYLQANPNHPADQTVIYTCGPEPMMRATAAIAARHHIECQACVEQAMACGMGTCQSCVVKVRNPAATSTPWRYRLACTDGPVFQANELIW
jgi:dihydroorotate dehydrogenase electron transfer subunit